MAIEVGNWADVTIDQLLYAGNFPVKVQFASGAIETLIVGGYMETPSGALALKRIVWLDDTHQSQVEFLTIAKDQWVSVESTGYLYDLEQVKENEGRLRVAQGAQEQQQRAAALSQRGIAVPNGAVPNRQMRRHPG